MAAASLAHPPPAAAQFRYIPPEAPRPGLSAPPAADPLSLGESLRRLVPSGLTIRFDRRLDTARRLTRSYGDWRTLAYAEGIAHAARGDEIHFRPAGLPVSSLDLVTSVTGRADWRIHAGETLRDALGRWTSRAGVRLLALTDRHYRIHAGHLWPRMTFLEAVASLMFAMSHLPRPPAAELDGATLVLSHRPPAAPPPAHRGPWSLSRGDTLRETLERWADAGGHEVRFETRRVWRLAGDRRFRGLTAREASIALVQALRHLPRPPRIELRGGVLFVSEGERPRKEGGHDARR